MKNFHQVSPVVVVIILSKMLRENIKNKIMAHQRMITSTINEMHITSLAITKRPTWLNVTDARLEKFEFSARPRFWPDKLTGVALLLFEFSEPVDEETLKKHNITTSALGHYIYLAGNPTGDSFRQAISVPYGKIKRIGIRLWNCTTPILLEEVSIASQGGVFHSEFRVENSVTTREIGSFEKNADSMDVLALNLLSSAHTCNAHCHAICQHWFKTMDDVQRRHPKDDAGRTNCYLDMPGHGRVPITVFHAQPAMLRIPKDISGYHEKIGDKSRNMIRKAQKLGYQYKKVDPDLYLDDVLAIRTSDPLRQGKPIPEYFKVRPTSIFDQQFLGGCQRHGEEFYGVFNGDTLIAYSTLYFYGQLAQVNHILGHKDHLKEGIMNLLLSEIVGDIIQHRPWVKAINYLYPDVIRDDSGVGMFKKSIGFRPESLIVTQSERDLSDYFAAPLCSEENLADTEAPAKKSAKAGTSKMLKESADTEHIIHNGMMKNRSCALEFAQQKLAELAPRLTFLRHQVSSEKFEDGSFPPDSGHAVVIEGMKFDGYQNFLSAGLKGFRQSVPKDAFLIFDFKLSPDLAYTTSNEGLARLLPRPLQSPARRINEDLIDYLSKRFKSTSLSIDQVKSGFKGSDYVVAGLIGYEHAGSHDSFDSILVLKKIR